MIKQFLTQQVTEAVVAGLASKLGGPVCGTSPAARTSGSESGFRIELGMRGRFQHLICDHEAAKAFLDHYAPVWQRRRDTSAESAV